MIINADLHIHSPYSKQGYTNHDFNMLSQNAEKKGLHFLSTGDCLHHKWLKSITHLTPLDEGTFQCKNTHFILSTEIETNDKVHHILFFPDITSLYDFKEQIKTYSNDFQLHARPNIQTTSEQLAHIAIDASALIGPSHIFDPFTGLYTYYDSLSDCYGSASKDIEFVELGLGLDTYHADKLKELHHLTYLTNSDTHNPHPIRLGREFTQFQVKKPTSKFLIQAIKRKNNNKPVLNAGFPPEEGKYYQTGCTNCAKPYSLSTAKKRKWTCKSCGGLIKKGIKQKIEEKATITQPHLPYHRPLYLSILPLHEIITRALNYQNPFTDTVEEIWDQLITTFGNEIHIMLETPIQDIEKVTNRAIAQAIKSFRLATFTYKKGCAGTYGTLYLE